MSESGPESGAAGTNRRPDRHSGLPPIVPGDQDDDQRSTTAIPRPGDHAHPSQRGGRPPSDPRYSVTLRETHHRAAAGRHPRERIRRRHRAASSSGYRETPAPDTGYRNPGPGGVQRTGLHRCRLHRCRVRADPATQVPDTADRATPVPARPGAATAVTSGWNPAPMTLPPARVGHLEHPYQEGRRCARSYRRCSGKTATAGPVVMTRTLVRRNRVTTAQRALRTT